jgi:hypothetical protein
VRRPEELTHGRELLFPADRIRVDGGLLDAAVCSEATPLANLSPPRWSMDPLHDRDFSTCFVNSDEELTAGSA